MPSRVLREGILTSERVNRLSPLAELFYRRLFSVADDHGRYYAHPGILRSTCYPLQVDKIKENAVLGWLRECESVGLLLVFLVGSTKYLQILEFRQQWRSKSKFPEPAADLISKCIANANHLPADPSAGPTTKERIRINEYVNTNTTTVVQTVDHFEDFWKAYPRKVKKQDARKAWERINPSPELLAKIKSAIESHRESDQWTRDDGKYIPHPTTWLNQARWDDVLESALSEAEKLRRKFL